LRTDRRKYYTLALSLRQLLALLIACNYFAFRTELFSDEYEENHPTVPAGIQAFTQSSLNWETFDKDNASKAFTISVDPVVVFLSRVPPAPVVPSPVAAPAGPVRDKSPPSSPSDIAQQAHS